MKPTLHKIDKLSIVVITVLIVGILSSFLDLGLISVSFSLLMPLLFILNCALAIYGIFKKKYFALIGVVLFLIFYNFFFQFTITKDIDTKDSVSVLVYNTAEFKKLISYNPRQNAASHIIKFIDSLNPDVLIFQETSYKGDTRFEDYPYYFLGYRANVAKSLQAIYSKYPIINKGYIDFPDTNNNALFADIKIHQDTIRIYNLHLQSFVTNKHIMANKYDNYSYWGKLNNTITKQIEQAKLIKNHAQKSKKKFIICGDFNATPYSQPHRILKKGLNDSYLSKGNGFGKTYSIFNYPLRLDYFLYDAQIKVSSHDNFTLKLSDHEPIFVKFKIK